MAENKIAVKRSPDKAKFKIQHDFDEISAYKELPSYSNELRQIARLLFKFCSSRRRDDSNLDFANTP